MTADQAQVLRALKRCRFVPATATKRFVRDVPADEAFDLTARQAAFLRRIAHHFRRQLAGRHRCTAECAAYRCVRDATSQSPEAAPRVRPAASAWPLFEAVTDDGD